MNTNGQERQGFSFIQAAALIRALGYDRDRHTLTIRLAPDCYGKSGELTDMTYAGVLREIAAGSAVTAITLVDRYDLAGAVTLTAGMVQQVALPDAAARAQDRAREVAR